MGLLERNLTCRNAGYVDSRAVADKIRLNWQTNKKAAIEKRMGE
jgi:hypothetical protein